MALDQNQIYELANRLEQARVTATPIAPLTEVAPTLSIEDAYVISEINMRRRIEQGKGKLLGKKIGLTSRAVQKQLGVEQPDFAHLASDMLVATGGSVVIKNLISPRVEGEVAFVLKRDLTGPSITAAHVIHATDFVLPCIEIIDSRVKDWKIKVQDTIADNASSALFVLGNRPHMLGQVDLRMAGMWLKINGEVESTGMGMACLDDPVNAVAWLANQMAALGSPLKAGEIILSGAYGPVVPVKAGDHCEIEINGLGSVSCVFE